MNVPIQHKENILKKKAILRIQKKKEYNCLNVLQKYVVSESMT